MTRVAGIVLAAGAGLRYGMPKALVRLGGELLVERAARVLAEGGCTPVVVVLGAAAAEVPPLPAATVVVNPNWESGMGSSLRTGLTTLRERADVDAALILLADLPGVTSGAVARVGAVAGRDVLAMGDYHGRRGHPVLLGRDHWAGVAAQAHGDVGARPYLRGRDVRAVPVGDIASDADVDTPADLGRAAPG